jgi:hypothetical protein
MLHLLILAALPPVWILCVIGIVYVGASLNSSPASVARERSILPHRYR